LNNEFAIKNFLLYLFDFLPREKSARRFLNDMKNDAKQKFCDCLRTLEFSAFAVKKFSAAN
jgi:hypothetical protein